MNEQLTATQERNLERARRLRDLYETKGPWGVHDHFDEFFHPGFEWQPAISQLGEQLYKGQDGFGRWISDMEAVATEFQQSDIKLRSVGDAHILVLGRMRLVGKESGAAFESEYGSVYEFEGGRAVRGRAFLTHADAERAAEEWAQKAVEAERQTR